MPVAAQELAASSAAPPALGPIWDFEGRLFLLLRSKTQTTGALAPPRFVIAMPTRAVHYPGTSGRSPFAGFDGSLAQTGAVKTNVHSDHQILLNNWRASAKATFEAKSTSDWGEVSDSFPMDMRCCSVPLEGI